MNEVNLEFEKISGPLNNNLQVESAIEAAKNLDVNELEFLIESLKATRSPGMPYNYFQRNYYEAINSIFEQRKLDDEIRNYDFNPRRPYNAAIYSAAKTIKETLMNLKDSGYEDISISWNKLSDSVTVKATKSETVK